MDRAGFEAKVDRSGECHLWTGSKGKRGYGNLNWEGKVCSAHRVAWELENGPVPSGLVIDHVCRVRLCVRVAHLRVVTPKVNALENSDSVSAKNALKTHCPQGHPYDERNTYLRKDRYGRECRACTRERLRRLHG